MVVRVSAEVVRVRAAERSRGSGDIPVRVRAAATTKAIQVTDSEPVQEPEHLQATVQPGVAQGAVAEAQQVLSDVREANPPRLVRTVWRSVMILRRSKHRSSVASASPQVTVRP
jgi:hypothetical protein